MAWRYWRYGGDKMTLATQIKKMILKASTKDIGESRETVLFEDDIERAAQLITDNLVLDEEKIEYIIREFIPHRDIKYVEDLVKAISQTDNIIKVKE